MRSSDFCLLADHVWDGKTDQPIEKGIVIIKNNKIEACGRQADIAVPDGMTEINYKNASILPCFIDGHTHTNYLAAGPDAGIFFRDYDDSLLFDIGKYNLQRSLKTGVTTLFDDGGYRDVTLHLRDALKAKLFEGADIWVSKCYLQRAHPGVPNYEGGDIDADDPDACGKFVEDLIVRDRVDWIKVMLTRSGGNRYLLPFFGNNAHFGPESLKRIVDTAHQYGRKVGCHCVTQSGINALIDAGGDLIVHCEFYDDNSEFTFNPELVKRIGDSGLWVNPTVHTSKSNHLGILYVAGSNPLSKEQQEEVEESKAHCALLFENIYNIWKTGAPMIAGTDAGYAYFDFGAFHCELETLHETGIPVMDVLKMATSNPAAFMGKAGEIGSLVKGAGADIVVLNGNVFQDISASADVAAVYKNGKHAA